MNAITYKEVSPLIKDNKVWLGATGNGNDMVFGVPEGAKAVSYTHLDVYKRQIPVSANGSSMAHVAG